MATTAYQAQIDAGQRFIETIAPGDTVILLFHGDADGCCSAAIAYRTLLEIGDELAFPAFMEKGEMVYSDALRKRILARSPQHLIVMDTGSRPLPIVPGLRTMVVDHHRPEGAPPVDVFATAYGIDPPASAALLTYQICKDFSRVGNLEWLAALGTAGDLGANADLDILRAARNRYGVQSINEAVALINAARRAPAFDYAAAFNALLGADGPSDIVDGRVPETPLLTGYREQVNMEFRRVLGTRPEFSGQWALLKFSSGALVHGMVASAWTRRLRDNMVIAANYGYTEGNVHFSIRSMLDVDLISELERVRPIRPDAEFGHGHPRATGGILPVKEFQSFLHKIGFSIIAADTEPRAEMVSDH